MDDALKMPGSKPKTFGPNGKVCALDARKLRGLGEKADSMRDQDLVLVRNKTGGADGSMREYDIMTKEGYERARRSDPGSGWEMVEDVNTPSGIPERTWMNVSVSAGMRDVPLPPNTDGLFWSISALEKFVWPYYEGMRIWTIDYLQDLKDALQSPFVVGFAHVGESSSEAIRSDIGEQARLVVDAPQLEGGPELMTLAQFQAFLASLSEDE